MTSSSQPLDVANQEVAAVTRQPVSESTSAPGSAASLDSLGYPIPSVPPTNMAPFMQKSPLPENFVFILGGSAICVFFIITMISRYFVIWKMNRMGRKDAQIRRSYNVIRKQAPIRPLESTKAKQSPGDKETNGLLSKPRVRFYGVDSSSTVSFERLREDSIDGDPDCSATQSRPYYSFIPGGIARYPSFSSNGRTAYHTESSYPKNSPRAGRGTFASIASKLNNDLPYLPLHVEKKRQKNPGYSLTLQAQDFSDVVAQTDLKCSISVQVESNGTSPQTSTISSNDNRSSKFKGQRGELEV